jgi:hypothetical protein
MLGKDFLIEHLQHLYLLGTVLVPISQIRNEGSERLHYLPKVTQHTVLIPPRSELNPEQRILKHGTVCDQLPLPSAEQKSSP